jgi:hypothetical protein
MTTTHKFTIKRTELGYITCCGTEVVKVTKNQDPEMWGSVNWYYQNAGEDIDSIPFYSYADIKKYLMKTHDRQFGTMEYTEWLLAETAKTLAKYAKVGA